MSTGSKNYKIIGLFIALVLPVLLTFANVTYSANAVTDRLVKEGSFWGLFVLLMLVMRLGENEGWSSLSKKSSLLQTSLFSILITISLFAATIIYGLSYKLIMKKLPEHEAMTDILRNYPMWLKALLAVRAGIFEEIFFRAYAITRLLQLTGNKFVAYIVPLLIFAGGHYRYGTINHVLGALALGIVLTIFYVKRKDLISNIIGHAVYDGLAMMAKTI